MDIKGFDRLSSNTFGLKELVALFLLILAIFSSMGCLQLNNGFSFIRDDGIEPASAVVETTITTPLYLKSSYDSASSDTYVPLAGNLALNFDSSIGPTSFRTWGTFVFQGDSSLSYLTINATLWKDALLVDHTKYMVIGVEPGHEYNFDISDNCFLEYDNGYSCVLEMQGPYDSVKSDRQWCQVVQVDSGLVTWDDNWQKNHEAQSSDSTTLSASKMASPSTYDERSIKLFAGDANSGALKEPYDLEEPISSVKRSSSLGREDQGKTYVGSVNSDKYHWPDCRYALNIKSENRIWFTDAEDARLQGYVPCKVCKPL